MGMFDPAFGDVLDRALILELKISMAGEQVESNTVDYWKAELSKCQEFLNKERVNLSCDNLFDERMVELRTLHTDLWYAEDEIRNCLKAKDFQLAGRWAATITKLNQRRSEIVGYFNKSHGKGADVKVYAGRSILSQ